MKEKLYLIKEGTRKPGDFNGYIGLEQFTSEFDDNRSFDPVYSTERRIVDGFIKCHKGMDAGEQYYLISKSFEKSSPGFPLSKEPELVSKYLEMSAKLGYRPARYDVACRDHDEAEMVVLAKEGLKIAQLKLVTMFHRSDILSDVNLFDLLSYLFKKGQSEDVKHSIFAVEMVLSSRGYAEYLITTAEQFDADILKGLGAGIYDTCLSQEGIDLCSSEALLNSHYFLEWLLTDINGKPDLVADIQKRLYRSVRCLKPSILEFMEVCGIEEAFWNYLRFRYYATMRPSSEEVKRLEGMVLIEDDDSDPIPNFRYYHNKIEDLLGKYYILNSDTISHSRGETHILDCFSRRTIGPHRAFDYIFRARGWASEELGLAFSYLLDPYPDPNAEQCILDASRKYFERAVRKGCSSANEMVLLFKNDGDQIIFDRKKATGCRLYRLYQKKFADYDPFIERMPWDTISILGNF